MSNIMGKLLLILFVFYTALSCSESGNFSSSEEITEADVFVNSPEYEEYASVLKKDRMVMANVFKKMSSNDKKRYFALFDSLISSKNRNEQLCYLEKIKNLSGIDLEQRLATIKRSIPDVSQYANLDKVAILKALQRKNIQRRGEQLLSLSDEEQKEACIKACEWTFLAEDGSCVSSPNSLVCECSDCGGCSTYHINDSENFFCVHNCMKCIYGSTGFVDSYCQLMAAMHYDKCLSGC